MPTSNQGKLLGSEVVTCPIHRWLEESKRKDHFPKRALRQFSDGVLVSRLIHCTFPRLVDLNNYYPRSSFQGKLHNWRYLNTNVLRKLNCGISEKLITRLVKGDPGAIQEFLRRLKVKVETCNDDSPMLKMFHGKHVRNSLSARSSKPTNPRTGLVFFGDDDSMSSIWEESAQEEDEITEAVDHERKRHSDELDEKIRVYTTMVNRKIKAVQNLDDQIAKLTHTIEKEEEYNRWKSPVHIHHSYQCSESRWYKSNRILSNQSTDSRTPLDYLPRFLQPRQAIFGPPAIQC